MSQKEVKDEIIKINIGDLPAPSFEDGWLKGFERGLEHAVSLLVAQGFEQSSVLQEELDHLRQSRSYWKAAHFGQRYGAMGPIKFRNATNLLSQGDAETLKKAWAKHFPQVSDIAVDDHVYMPTTVCDCGGTKANTSHVDWCALRNGK